ncbi:MAG TPA: hypothetical protein VMH79_04325 [Thermoanaerobaculia bacterium]|nr:hypothetical protein [Thermoanaerobaculia bacterium]
MIVFEAASAPAARSSEALAAGRRVAGRLLPYGPDGDGRFPRFDPLDRRFTRRRHDAVVAAGPADAEAWAEAIARLPSGPLLVGPGSSPEDVWGAYRAAATAALAAGRAVYLLDPEPEGIPADAGRAAVALCTWRPGRAFEFPSAAAARRAGVAAAAVFPAVPGWTGEADALEAIAAAAVGAGAASLTAVVPETDGESRRALVEVRTDAEPEAGEAFFETVHHGAWGDRMPRLLARAREAATGQGLLTLPPRPVGRGERAGNAAASARLEELADARESEEHKAALAHAAVRWIDDAGRDLAAVAREGNFRKVFPFEAELAETAEAAFREVR